MVGVITPGGKLSALAIDADLAMGAHAITINAGGLIDGVDVDEISALVVFPLLTNTHVEAITPTGDATLPARLNVDDANEVQFTAINKYVEFDLLKTYFLDSFRTDTDYTDHDGNGSFKIAYWNGVAWLDWETGIVTTGVVGGGGNFIAWSTSTLINTRKIRLICTAVDTRGGSIDKSMCYCLQLKKT